ncbi:MAG: hypothetical protein JSU00_18775 [Acidobacteria bacterium]|nr:hypothetical protein [Acidobacteriota bacterium]
MKIKKAIRRLEEARALIGDVIERCPETEEEERHALQAVHSELARVREAFQRIADRKAKPLPPQSAARAVRGGPKSAPRNAKAAVA